MRFAQELRWDPAWVEERISCAVCTRRTVTSGVQTNSEKWGGSCSGARLSKVPRLEIVSGHDVTSKTCSEENEVSMKHVRASKVDCRKWIAQAKEEERSCKMVMLTLNLSLHV